MSLKLGAGFFLFSRVILQADYVFVSNAGDGTIERFDSSGHETIFASGLNAPAGLAFDPAGNLYVADSGDGTILRYDPGGSSSVFVSGLNNPRGIAFDPGGNLYVASQVDGTILKFGTGGGQSTFASGLALDSDDAYLAVDGSGNVYANTVQRILEFNSSGSDAIVYQTGLFYVEGMAVDAAGDLYVAHQNSGLVRRVLGSGGPDTDITNYPAPYNFVAGQGSNTPLDLAFDHSGNLYATFGSLYPSNSDPVISGVIVEFNLDGPDTILATGTGGQYLAVQPVPEARVSTMLLVGGLFLGGCQWRRQQRRSAAFRL